jgi:cation diffusion facilitator CzcD-associated flavoprotein CzcO
VTDAVAKHVVPVEADQWISDFSRALENQDPTLLRALFVPEVNWRDNMALTWTLRQEWGVAAVEDQLCLAVCRMKATGWRQSPAWHEPGEVVVNGRKVIEIVLEFETEHGRGLALIWAQRDTDAKYGLRAYNLYTRLEELKCVEAKSPFPPGRGFASRTPTENWLEHREARRAFDDREPEVLIVGGGHGGAFAAAHLDRLGVDYLIVERNERMGDNWRKRYRNLALHTPIQTCHFPFLPFPENFPTYIPKDKLANWIEFYADALDLNYWTSTEFVGASYDSDNEEWSARIRRSDGSERLLRPRHIVLATGGIGGLPHVPSLPGLESFTGEILHSAQFNEGSSFQGKRAIVVGAATSAHDIAYELYQNGAEVTMLQRGAVTVTAMETANLVYGDYMTGESVEVCDLRLAAGRMAPVMKEKNRAYTKRANELDAELHARLRAAGMELDDGEDGTGWPGKFARQGGGFYLNIGASDVIADGGIGIKQYRDIDRFVPEGLAFADGSLLAADVVILCTGYQNRAAELKLWFDEDIADRFDDIGSVGNSGEYANAWIPSAQKGLWFMLAGFMPARVGAPFLAMGIKADLEGLIPDYARALPADRSQSLARKAVLLESEPEGIQSYAG